MNLDYLHGVLYNFPILTQHKYPLDRDLKRVELLRDFIQSVYADKSLIFCQGFVVAFKGKAGLDLKPDEERRNPPRVRGDFFEFGFFKLAFVEESEAQLLCIDHGGSQRDVIFEGSVRFDPPESFQSESSEQWVL